VVTGAALEEQVVHPRAYSTGERIRPGMYTDSQAETQEPGQQAKLSYLLGVHLEGCVTRNREP